MARRKKKKTTNAVFIGKYQARFRDKKGRFSSLSRAHTYQLLTSTQKQVFKKPQVFPDDLKRAREKAEYLSNVARGVDIYRQKKRIKARLARAKKRESELEAKLKRTKRAKKQAELLSKIEKLQIKIEKERDTLHDRLVPFVEKKTVISRQMARSMDIKKMIFDLDPTPFNPRNMRKKLEGLKPYFVQAFEEIWKKTKRSQRLFLLRFLYEARSRWKDAPEMRAFGLPRFEILRLSEVERVTDELIDQMVIRFIQGPTFKGPPPSIRSYFASGFVVDEDPEPQITGFTIEYPEKTGRRVYSDEELEKIDLERRREKRKRAKEREEQVVSKAKKKRKKKRKKIRKTRKKR